MECLLCGESLEEGETVNVKRGLPAIIAASIRRGDNVHEQVPNTNSVCVHKQCRRDYTRASSIEAASKTDRPSGSVDEDARQLRSEQKAFDFKNHCLFCGEEAKPPDVKYPAHRRRSVHNVETVRTANKISDLIQERDDDWARTVHKRILNVVDLFAAESRYHLDCYNKFQQLPTGRIRGRPEDSHASSTFRKLCQYLDENDECQYSTEQLVEIMTEISGQNAPCYTEKWLKTRLKTHYGDKITVTEHSGKVSLVSLHESTQNILTNNWYNGRINDIDTEKLRIVKMAATIIRNDIDHMIYDCSVYPSMDDITNGGTNLVPNTLRVFTETVTKKKKKLSHDIECKRLAINHAVIAACRPRSFISPIHIGIAVHLHRRVGSRHLIDLLNSVGACSSYNEALVYQKCAMTSIQPTVDDSAFIQFVFDNADVNMRTLDGFGTFHSLGGIKCITPAKSLTPSPIIRRDSSHTPKEAEKQDIRILAYRKPLKVGLKKVVIKDMKQEKCEAAVKARQLDLTWLCGLNKCSSVPNWSGYMQTAMEGTGHFEVSQVIAIPFIRLNPGNLSTLYSALSFAANQSLLHNQCCIVTFDQPLYMKASEIVAAADENTDISKVIVRLGGFHLIMSFLGSIGHIMKGSGLEELWKTVYAEGSITHMLTGHAYSRAMRAHILSFSALADLIIKLSPDLQSNSITEIAVLAEKLFTNITTVEEPCNVHLLQRLMSVFESAKTQIANTSRTARLWLQYFEQVSLVLQFIRAERTGNWNLHISTVIKMLPYFHAAGHLLYAKSAHLYAQQMTDLEHRMSEQEYVKFTTHGYFTIRRSNRFWSGIYTDMCIEQLLMRSLKSIGGLTHGRGITENTLSLWILAAPACVEVAKAIEAFTGTSVATTDQHVDVGPTRQAKDVNDRRLFKEWLEQHNPFTRTSCTLVCISSGRVADDTVTCDNALQIGTKSMEKIIGNNFADVHLHRKDKVVPLATTTSGIKIRDEIIAINSQQLFNRIMCVARGPEELKSYFEYELAPQPPSLFDAVSLRKGNKSSIVNIFQSEQSGDKLSKHGNIAYIVDGGNLLHSVIWPHSASYGDVLDTYVSYVLTNYGQDCTVVFDGYPSEPTTKGEEQRRRERRKSSIHIQFENSMKTTTTSQDFLGNTHNKVALITALTAHLIKVNINVAQAEADADLLIVSTALQKARNGLCAIVVGQDTDLLILLTALATIEDNVWFMRPSKGNKDSTYFDIHKQKLLLGDMCNVLLFLHAATGCDTTSAIFRKGKRQAATLLQRNTELRTLVKIFNDPTSTKKDIAVAGEHFLLHLYGAKVNSSLNKQRYFAYNRAVAKLSVQAKFDLATLPPTYAASTQHFYRVYLQVQQWLGNNLVPTDWGWKLEKDQLLPVTTTMEPAPQNLLKLILCNCKTDCSKQCECKRAGLQCSAMCGHCQGLDCNNSPTCDDKSDEDCDFCLDV